MLTKGADIRTPKKHKQIHKHKNMKVYTKIHGRVHTNRIWNSQTKKDQYSMHTNVQGQHTLRKVGTENIHTSTQQHGTLHISTQQKGILHTRNSVISWEFFDLLGYGATSLSDWCAKFRDSLMVLCSRVQCSLNIWCLKLRQLCALGTSSTTEPVSRLKNENLNCTAAKP
jgi:hypothetical protein